MSPDADGPRRLRVLWVLLPLLGGLLLLPLLAGVLLARDATQARAALLDAEQQLRAVQQALGAADLDAAQPRLDDARAQLETARARSEGVLWDVAAVLPLIGEPVRIVHGVIEVATVATDLVTTAVRDGGAVLTDGVDIRVVDGEVDLAPIDEGAALVAGLPVEALRSSIATLEASGTRWTPEQLRDARWQTLELGTELLTLLDRADALLGALPGYLGADGPRSYFLGVQTSAELRSTGGLIGFYTVLTVDGGTFSTGPVEVYDGVDGQAEEGGPPAAAIERPPGSGGERVTAPVDFMARYARTGATANFSNVNIDPDLPLTAGITLELFELRTGLALDGVILLDAIGLQAVLEATGTDVALDPELLTDTDLPEVVPAADFARFITEDIYADLGAARTGARRAVQVAVGEAAFEGVFSGGWDGERVARTVADITAERHLQVHSTDADEQAALTAVGATGAFAEPPATGDRLAVTANNAVGGKQDVHLGHRFAVSVDLLGVNRSPEDGPEVWRTTAVRTETVNPLPATGMDEYIIGNCPISEPRNQCFDGPPGWNRTWWSVWSPGSDRLRAATGPGGALPISSGDLHGLRVFDRIVETPPGGSAWFALRLEGRVTVETDGDDLLYTWSWWRQAKAVPDLLDVRITPPPGYRIVDHRVVGIGDNRRLLGLDAGAAPATVTVDHDRAHLEGAVSRDTSLTLRMSRTVLD